MRRNIAAGLLLAWVVGVPASHGVRAQAPTAFCSDDPNRPPDRPPVLPPVDDARRRPDFLRFRNELKAIARRHDEPALMRVVDPQIRMSFGDNNGIENFRTLVHGGFGQPAAQFWSDFARVLDLGGTLSDAGDGFVAPYVYSTWPDHYDAFACAAVIGTNVRVREGPGRSARIVTSVSHAIVRLHASPQIEWNAVELADGRRGYILSRYLYGPTRWRAFFSYDEGRWRMNTFVAGD